MNDEIYCSHLPLNIAYNSNFLKALKELNSVQLALKEILTSEQYSKCSKHTELLVKETEQILNNPSNCIYTIKGHDLIHSLDLVEGTEYIPWIFYVRGQLPSREKKSFRLSIVGTRKPNLYGIKVLKDFFDQTQSVPYEVISGLAIGIDTWAHELSSQQGRPNFAVLGHGLMFQNFQSKRQLISSILSVGGGLLSEFPPLAFPKKQYFPWRNRFISFLSHLLWVVQGTIQSGTRHTALHALNQGRSIAVTPGDIFSELSAMPHWLLSQGALPLNSAKDFIDFLSSSGQFLTNCGETPQSMLVKENLWQQLERRPNPAPYSSLSLHPRQKQ